MCVHENKMSLVSPPVWTRLSRRLVDGYLFSIFSFLAHSLVTIFISENNLKENVRFFSSYARKKRDPVTMTVESVARSSLECTVKCTTAYYCKGANFKKLSADKGTCRLFVEYADPTHLTVNVNWKYFETYDMP